MAGFYYKNITSQEKIINKVNSQSSLISSKNPNLSMKSITTDEYIKINKNIKSKDNELANLKSDIASFKKDFQSLLKNSKLFK